jgi:GDP-4-dehydro-6-deoxy-D-mannose reductase
MVKSMITGASGFVGQHLKTYLESEGWEVKGSKVDIRNYEDLRNQLDKYRPNYIFHLAAQAYVPESITNPYRTFEVNTLGSLNLLEAIKQLGIKTKVLLAGTSEEFGDTSDEEEPITEKSLPHPLSPYAISKLAMDHLGQLYAHYGLEVVVTRAYNHAGPGRGEMYAESAFAKQIVEVELGRRKLVEHGNLESVRNYTDVRDIVKAYKLAIELPPDVYSICSDNNISMQEIMNILIANAKCPISTKINPALYRPGDFSFKTPSCEKFKELTNWKPTIFLANTMADILQDWRSKL